VCFLFTYLKVSGTKAHPTKSAKAEKVELKYRFKFKASRAKLDA